MIDEAYQKEYIDFIQPFNQLLSSETDVDWSKVSNEISAFCMKRNAELPEKSEKWCSPFFIQWDQAVCILAHSKLPTRCLAVFDVNKGTFHRLELKEKKGLNAGIRLCKANNSLKLAGTKRGFWCAHVGTAQLKVDMEMIENDKTVEDQMISLYLKFVADMEVSPFKTGESIAYKQQFDMTKYPNASWKTAIANVKEKKTKTLGKRAQTVRVTEKSRKRPCDWVNVTEIPNYVEGIVNMTSSKLNKEQLNHLLNKKMPSDKIFIQDELDKLEKEDRLDYTKSCDQSELLLFDEMEPPPPPPDFELNIED